MCMGGELDMRVLQGYGVGRYNEASKFGNLDVRDMGNNTIHYPNRVKREG